MKCTMRLTTKTVVDLLTERLKERDQAVQIVCLHAVYDAAGALIVSALGFKPGTDAPAITLTQQEIAQELVLALNARRVGAFTDAVRFCDTGCCDLRGAGQVSAGETDTLNALFTAVIGEPLRQAY